MNLMTFDRVLFVVVVAGQLNGFRAAAHAQASNPAATEPAPQGLLPVPDYSGNLWQRAYLSGDWGGTRADLAEKGIQFELNWNQYVQGIVDGGRDQTTRYGGHLDYLINLDLMRMGVLDGALVKIRAESRYGNSVNGQAGPILPVNTDAFFPLTSELDEDIAITVTDLNYTQFLSPKFAVYLGKIDTLDGDPNEFASGRGTSQFMNANFVFNPVLALRLPYSTLAGGLVWLPVRQKDKSITVTSTIFNTTDSSTTTGFEDFGEGTSWTTEADFQYRFGCLPGGMNLGFLYSFDQDFAQIGGDFIFQPGEGLIVPTDSSTWAVYWSGWQYLCVEDDVDAPISLNNGMPDREGVGLFARVGFADQDTNPIELAISGGVGGRGIIPSRDLDTFGVGYYYTAIQDSLVSSPLPLENNAQGFEAFYNIAITPAARLTFDVQVVDSASSNLDTAVILGVRLGLRF